MRQLVTILTVAASVLFTGPADADTLHVPGEYATIQAAIDAAVDGDVVEIADGRYTGAGNKNLDFFGKAITVRSASGDPALCIIDCEDDGRGFFFHSGEGPDSIVLGLTVTNGLTGSGGGVYCGNSSPTLTNCTISRNTGTNGGGVYCEDDSSPVLADCTISENLALIGGGGVYCINSSPALTNCSIGRNAAGSGAGGGVLCRFGSPAFTNCTINGNVAPNHSGGGVYSLQGSATFTNCTFHRNAVRFNGGGVRCVSCSQALINCTISENFAGSAGGGTYSDRGSSLTLSNCIVWNDRPDEIVDATPSITTVHFSDVQGGWEGPGNIDADPLFDDPVNDNYRLASGSPCIDAADNTAVPEGIETDLDGNPRFVDDPATKDTGNGDPPIVDMGAYEFQAGAGGCTRDPQWICDGDVDGDGQVNPVDAGLVQAAFGFVDEQALCNYDVDCDGQINPVDGGIVQSLFGTCEAPRGVCP